MNTEPRTSRSQKTRSPAALICAALLALAAAALAGCAHFQAWGQKSSSTPGSVGGAFNIPL